MAQVFIIRRINRIQTYNDLYGHQSRLLMVRPVNIPTRSIMLYVDKLFESRPELVQPEGVDLRSRFRAFTGSTHPHKYSANTRANGRNYLKTYITEKVSSDYDVHEISGGLFDHGSWSHHHVSDLKANTRTDERPIRPHVLVLVDVDYYVDMPAILAKGAEHGLHQVIMYTMTPEDLVYTAKDHFYYILNQEVHLKIAGGGCYRHQLWYYGEDQLMVRSWFCDYIYNVEKRKIGNNWSIIVLTYVQKIVHSFFREPTATILRRCGWKQGCFNVMEVFDTESEVYKRWLCVSRVNDPTIQFKIPVEVVLEIMSRSEMRATRTPSTGDVEYLLNCAKVPNSKTNAALLTLFMTEGFAYTFDDLKFKLKKVRNKVTYNKLIKDENQLNPHSEPIPDGGVGLSTSGNVTMQVCGPSPLGLGTCPTRGYNSERVAIDQRLHNVKNVKEVPYKYTLHAMEFFKLIFGAKTILSPLTLPEVRDEQTRPSQKAAAARRDGFDTPNFKLGGWSYFQKIEAYADYPVPRPIVDPPTDIKEEYSKYTYPIFRYLSKNCSWFAFGKQPALLARTVHECVRDSATITPTDFSRWDGHHSEFLARLELDVLKNLYPDKDHPYLQRCWDAHYLQRASTSSGVKVDIGWARLTGSPDTALFNTYDNAFVAYCAYRESGCSPGIAYRSLGVYGGDDGINPDMDIKTFMVVCEDLGLKFTGQTQDSNDSVTFLGRIYTNPKIDSGSISDVSRCLSKLHLAKLGTTPEQGLANKIDGYLATDPEVPFFSDYLRLYKKIYAKDIVVKAPDRFWAKVLRATSSSFPLPSYNHCVKAIAENMSGDRTVLINDVEDWIATINSGELPDLPQYIPAVKHSSVTESFVRHKEASSCKLGTTGNKVTPVVPPLKANKQPVTKKLKKQPTKDRQKAVKAASSSNVQN